MAPSIDGTIWPSDRAAQNGGRSTPPEWCRLDMVPPIGGTVCGAAPLGGTVLWRHGVWYLRLQAQHVVPPGSAPPIGGTVCGAAYWRHGSLAARFLAARFLAARFLGGTVPWRHGMWCRLDMVPPIAGTVPGGTVPWRGGFRRAIARRMVPAIAGTVPGGRGKAPTGPCGDAGGRPSVSCSRSTARFPACWPENADFAVFTA